MSGWVSSWMRGEAEDMKQEEEENQDQGNMLQAGDSAPQSADDIRRRRLERLQALQEQQQRQDQERAQQEPEAKPQQVKATPPKPPTINTAEEPKQAKRSRLTSASPKKAHSLLNNMLERILRLTLASQRSSSEYIYVKNVADQGQTELTAENVSEVLYMRVVMDPMELSNTSHPLSVLEYLEHSFYRCRDELHTLSSPHLRLMDDEKKKMEECIANVRQMCVNYSVTSLTEPEMFPFEVGSINIDALDKSIRNPPNAQTPEWLELLTKELQQNDVVAEVFTPIFQKLVAELFQINPPSIFANFYQNAAAISLLCRIKSLAQIFASLPGFLLTPGAPETGRRLQDATALGILHRFSTADDPQVKQMFQNITKRTRKDVNGSITSIRTKLTSLQNACTDVVKLLLKAGGDAREQTLQWMEQACRVNVERTKENPNNAITSTNGTMLNVTMVLLRLCGPFLAPDSKKQGLIDTQFLAANNSVFPDDTTRLVVDASDSARSEARDFNFITRCFFLTARAVHLGPVVVIRQYMRLLRHLSYLQNRMGDQADPRVRAQFESMASTKMVMDAELLHPDLIHDLLRFVFLSARVVTSICRNESVASTTALTLPLSPPDLESNQALKFLPEHLVEDVCSILIFVSRLEPKALHAFPLDDLLNMLLVFLSSPEYVRSPHLRAKMSEVLFHIFLPSEEAEERETAAAPLGTELLVRSPLAQQHLAPCLLYLYGDVEQTGFYEKLEHRYNIACLLKYLWKLEAHKQAFHRIAEDRQRFVRFAHGLMNHINGLVTDALIALPEIKQLQAEMQDVSRWNALDESAREEKRSLLADKERTVTSSLQLANETIHMMSYLTSEIKDPFVTMPELEERLVGMLNSVLVKLAGPRGVDLKVNNPEQYKFRPKVMLQEIVQTFLHFADFDSFVSAVAANGYYDGQVFSKCGQIVKRTQLLSFEEIALFDTFIANVAQASLDATNWEEQLGEIPEEFLDPLVFTLMKDPVTLPTSGYTMDRATITQHLLNDQTDPFTRAPLTAEELESNTELKDRMDAWLLAQRKE